MWCFVQIMLVVLLHCYSWWYIDWDDSLLPITLFVKEHCTNILTAKMFWSSEQDIVIYVNSPGGSVTAGNLPLDENFLV